MFNFQMSREEVEKLLDLQVQTGNMSEQLKEEKLREFDMLTQQRAGGVPNQQYGQMNGMPNQQFGQVNEMPGQADRVKYPRIKPQEGYLNTPEMIGTLVIAILIVVAAKKGSAAFVGLLMGILFTYIGVKIIFKDRKEGKRIQFISIVAAIVGVLMLGYGFFKIFGSDGAQSEFDRIGNAILPFIIIGVGFAIIIGYAVSVSAMKKRYTIPVQATCIQLVIPRNGARSPRMRAPMYEYWYNGEKRRTFKNVFSNRGNPAINEIREIYVSATDDGGYYDPVGSKTQFIFTILIGLIFIVIGGIVVYLSYFR